MTFKQTKAYHTLLNHFCNFGNDIKYDVRKEETAKNLFEKTAKYYGAEKTMQVAKKANQKLHMKLYPTK